MRRRRLSILGSTGSIGTTTLSLVERFPLSLSVVALGAGRNVDRLAQQIERYRPDLVSVADEGTAEALLRTMPSFRGRVLWGEQGACAIAAHPEADLVVSAMVGAAGLAPTLAAIEAGKDVALANKEVLVVAGELVTGTASKANVRVLPVDSEHNAIFQALQGQRQEDVKRITLTASGGPFLERPLDELATVTPGQALRHPTWKMGAKVTIDSSTLMNKGLELIEARWLFDVPAAKLDVLIHPQSIVHSMVEYRDGSVIAQMAVPDMTIPIAYALSYPERLDLGHLPRLDLVSAPLSFAAPDLERFPCLGLAYRALEIGNTMPAVLNAANEVAVELFSGGEIGYLDIPHVIEAVMDAHEPRPADGLTTLLAADRWARQAARAEAAARAGESRRSLLCR